MDDSQAARARQVLIERYLQGEVVGLAQTRKRSKADARAPVVAVQTEGSKRPFFLLHGSTEGAAYLCYMLARGLGDDQPLYALEPYTHADPDLPSLDVIAAAHIRSLRSVQAEGPYLLGGICNGGLIAYEMARQLQALGERVALVVLMDPWPGGRGSPLSHRFARWAIARGAKLRHWDEHRQLAIFLHIYNSARMAHNLLVRSRDWLETVARSRMQSFASTRTSNATRRKVAACASASCMPQASSGCQLLPSHYSALFRWAALTYDPPHPYDGPLTYFWPSKGVGNRRGWRTSVRQDDATYVVMGTQDSWRGDDLPALTLQLRSCLDVAQAGESLSCGTRGHPQTKDGR